MKKTKRTRVSDKIYEKLKKNKINKYTKKEIEYLVKLNFETIKEIILEEPEGVLINKFGTFKIKTSFYRDTFGTKKIKPKKKVSFSVSKKFSKTLNEKK